ncbi:MAG: 3-hydroxyacyl-ACP dehydratase FabZ family protein, partial [Spirochaetaceae bacterium]
MRSKSSFSSMETPSEFYCHRPANRLAKRRFVGLRPTNRLVEATTLGVRCQMTRASNGAVFLVEVGLYPMDDKVTKLLPHRPPFLFVDRIAEATEERIVGYRTFTKEEPFFQGHFPDYPVVP